MNLLVVRGNLGAKVYAPRGTLTYKVHKETQLGQTYWKVDSMVITSPEREYPLDEGILLVQA